MNDAELLTAQLIEETLRQNAAFQKVDRDLYVIKQGSAYVMINVIGWGKDRAMVRCTAQLVKGAQMDGTLATQLLELNGKLRFGAFAWVPSEAVVTFSQSILGGSTLDAEELMSTLREVALIADEYDDKIMAKYGGARMLDLLEEAALSRIAKSHAENPISTIG
jgi:hypothetical protein